MKLCSSYKYTFRIVLWPVRAENSRTQSIGGIFCLDASHMCHKVHPGTIKRLPMT